MNQSEKLIWAAVFGAEYAFLRQSGCTSDAQALRAATRASEAIQKLRSLPEDLVGDVAEDIPQMLDRGFGRRDGATFGCPCGKSVVWLREDGAARLAGEIASAAHTETGFVCECKGCGHGFSFPNVGFALRATKEEATVMLGDMTRVG